MNDNTIFNVKNRSDGMVVYSIPEMNIRREFAAGETKKIPYIELEKLSFQSGGRELIQDYLQVKSQEVIDNLNIKAEPEYFMDEAAIRELLVNGSYDSFLDCLDFAPEGVLNLLKRMAVDLPLGDMNKRKAIKDKLGFDIEAAIKNNEASKDENAPADKPAERRVQPTENASRRTTPKYNIVNEEKKDS